MEHADPRKLLEQLIRKNGDDFASISAMLGKNPAYIQQFIRRGSPKKLDELDRQKLADFYSVDEQLLGAPAAKARRVAKDNSQLVPVKQLDIGASAGAGSLVDDAIAGAMAFDPKWLKQLGVDPAKLSLISVDGDSMDPTLGDGDLIMVDHAAVQVSLRDGIHVLRMDDVLLVKRLAIGPSGKISIRSDNSQYPDWDNVDVGSVNIIGRVVWTGRRL